MIAGCARKSRLQYLKERLKNDIIAVRYPALRCNRNEIIRGIPMKRILLIAALAGSVATASQAASFGDLNGAAVRKALSGKTVFLSTSGIVLPIAYRSNGTMSGHLQASAAALAGNASMKDSGRWWISNDRLCQRWKRWQGAKSYCYKLSRQGKQVVWVRDDGRRGTARISS